MQNIPLGQTQIALLLMLVPTVTVAEAPVEELPPPATKSVLVRESPFTKVEEPAPNEALETGWALCGVRARHYFVDESVIADYSRDGRRYIVALAAEDPATHAKVDANYLYYREYKSGHRWAIGRQPHLDRTYSVYFQAAAQPGTWQLVQRARASWDDQPVFDLPDHIYLLEPTCGN